MFSWEAPKGFIYRGEGFTRDISVRGAYVYAATCPPVDVLIQVEITLPQVSRKPRTAVIGKMRTQRVEKASQEKASGFSATGKDFALRPVSRLGPRLVKSKAKTRKGS